MAISKDEIIHIAKLSSLNLTDEEIERYAKDMTDILEFAEIVNNLNTDDIKETVGINGEYNVLTIEDGILNGGLGSQIQNKLNVYFLVLALS